MTTKQQISSEPAAPITNDERAARYARCVEASKRIRWDIEDDVIQGRHFDAGHKFLPDGLSKIDGIAFLSEDEKRYLSQIQGRTYANVFGLVERFINAKVLEISRGYWLGDQVALEGLIRFCDEELKHQELFRRIERLAAEEMPEGYEFTAEPNAVASAVLGKSTWAVLGLTLDIELFTQLHYKESIEADTGLSPLFKDVFQYHWKEEAQHAVMDELEWIEFDQGLTEADRDKAVNELIELVGAVDQILQAQAEADSRYFADTCGRPVSEEDRAELGARVLDAYRWQFIFSGVQHPHFVKVLTGLITENQAARIHKALATIN